MLDFGSGLRYLRQDRRRGWVRERRRELGGSLRNFRSFGDGGGGGRGI